MSDPTLSIAVMVDPTNPGQFFACCGLLELADRLWPQTDDRKAAEGWFTGGQFEISCDGTLRELLACAQQIQFASNAEEEAEDSDEDENEVKDDVVTPLELVVPVTLRLDWWQDINLKPWAGSMNARNIALAMCRAINPDDPDPLNQSQVVPEVKEVVKSTKGGKPKPKEPFHFDARRGSNSLGRDVGFIHDTLKKKWKTPMFAHPVVEFFALLGLQRARPQPTDRVRVYDYFTWSRAWRCQAALLPLAVCGLFGDPQARRYRFVNAFRTGQRKHKAYMPASPIPTGDRP
jgi:CRISPR-associated protein Csx14